MSRFKGILPLLGLSFWQAWWMCTSTTQVVAGPRSFGLDSIHFLMLVSLAGYIAVTACAPKLAPYGERRLLPGVGIAGFAGSLVVTLATHVDMGAIPAWTLMAAGCGALAISNAFLLLMWGERWSTLAGGDVGKQLSTSFAFAFAIYYLLLALPTWAAAFANAALCPLSCWALSLSRLMSHRSESMVEIKLKPVKILALVVSLFAVSFAFGSMQQLAFLGQDLVGAQARSMLVAWVFVICFALLIAWRKSLGDPYSFYRPMLPALACGILICQMVPPEYTFAGNGLIIFGIYCLDMFMMFAATDLAFRAKRPVALIFGTAICVARAGTLVGSLCGGACIAALAPGNDPEALRVVVLGLACVVVLTGTVLFSEKDLREVLQPDAKPHVPDLEERCELVAKKGGLTARELEVMRLLAQGRSVAVISDALGIAPGTVKHHASNTYRKLGIYDRQGLIDLVTLEHDAPSS